MQRGGRPRSWAAGNTTPRSTPFLGGGVKKPFFAALPKKLMRSWSDRRLAPRRSPFVVCRTDYTEDDLMEFTVPTLTRIMREYNVGKAKGRQKRLLAEDIMKARPDIDFEQYTKPKKREKRPDQPPIDEIEFRRHDALVEYLIRYTHDELKKAVLERGSSKEGRKMEVAERLAALMEHQFRRSLKASCTAWKPPSPQQPSQRPDERDEGAKRAFLKKRTGDKLICYSDYIDVSHFVQCVMLNATLWHGRISMTKSDLLLLMKGHGEAMAVENLQSSILAKCCREIWVQVKDSDSVELLLEKFHAEKTVRMKVLNTESHQGVYNTLKEWLKEVYMDLYAEYEFSQIDAMADAEVLDQVNGTEDEEITVEEGREMLKDRMRMEIEFYPRALSLLAAQVVFRMMTLNTQELGFILGRAADTADALLDNRARKVLEDVFLEMAVPAFRQLYDEIMQQTTSTQMAVEEDESSSSVDPQLMLKKRDVDPFTSIGIVFGGAQSDPVETFSSIRCLLDHIQTAPYGTDPLKRTPGSSGLCLALYYIDTTSPEAKIYRLSLAEFLSLDASTFEKSERGIWNLGTSFESFSDFMDELMSFQYLISLTPSLDVAADETGYRAELAELDTLFLGSPSGPRYLIQDLYGCMTYLRTRGFLTAPMYSIQKDHLREAETWSQGFERWCRYHGLDKKTQAFYIRPANRHGRLPRLESTGMAEMMDTVKALFAQDDMENAILQPVPAEEGYVDFECTVLETDTGPVALMPTEYELLPEEYVRSLSSPLRRYMPPRFSSEKIEAMRRISVRVFEELGLSGYACIQGRLMIDSDKERALKNEELTYPRPIPDFPDPIAELPLANEVHAHMRTLMQEREQELDAIVESYDTSEYTPETLAYFAAQDAEDAKRGITINRVEHLHQIVENIRHRHVKTEDEKQRPLELLMWNEALDRFLEEQEPPSNAALCRGEDFSVVLTGVHCHVSFAMDALIFQQAAMSGLSHSAVLRHLINLKLPPASKLPVVASRPAHWHPLCKDELRDESKEEESPEQIWVLCGGDGTGHQASLASGMNAVMKLRRGGDVQAYLFVMDPGRRTAATPEVLKALHEQRERFLKLGASEEALPQEYSDHYLASPRVVQNEMPWKPVWCLTDAQSLSSTVDEALEAADRFRQIESSAEAAHKTLDTAFRETLLNCQRELHDAGVLGVAAQWGGKVDTLSPAPRMMTMDVFASEASSVGATVFVAVHGDIAQDGTLQNFLDSYGLRYTGCDETATQLCGDKDQTGRYLDELEMVFNLPQRFLLKPDLTACATDSTKAQELFSEASQQLGKIPSLCLKPTRDGFGGGVARIASPVDLETYGLALEQRWESILSRQFSQPHCTISMPKPQAEEYILEPYIPPVEYRLGPSGRLMKATAQDYIEVSFGLVGELGRMWVFTPSLILSNLQTQDPMEQRLLRGIKSAVTPIPSSIVRPAQIQKARKTVEKLADAMGLRGVARVDAFMEVRNGDLTILEVDVTPYLGEHSLILQQAALEDPPMYPDEVFQQIVQAASAVEPEREEPESDLELDADKDEDSRMPPLDPWEDNEFWETEDMTQSGSLDSALEPQETLSNLWGSDDEDEIPDTNQTVQNTS